MTTEDPTPGDVTRLLGEVGRDDGSAAARLMPLVHHELRRIAESLFRRESPAHTLQPTALVHEAFIRLNAYAGRSAEVDSRGEPGDVPWNDRAHFFAIAASAMRQVLVDHARRRRAARRGGPDAVRVELDGVAVTDPDAGASAPDVLDLDDALNELAATRPRAARVVDLRFFGGMTEQSVADLLGISRKTAAADWAFARAWLTRRLDPDAAAADARD